MDSWCKKIKPWNPEANVSDNPIAFQTWWWFIQLQKPMCGKFNILIWAVYNKLPHNWRVLNLLHNLIYKIDIIILDEHMVESKVPNMLHCY